jgi:hypothetical protein
VVRVEKSKEIGHVAWNLVGNNMENLGGWRII